MPKKKNYGQQPVIMNMTGDEFKRLIEQRDPNAVVDTLHEVLAMFEGISDGETIADYLRRLVADLPAESVGTEQIKDDAVMFRDLNEEVRDKMLNSLTDEDMEKWFDDDPTNDDPDEDDTSENHQTETGE